jgi:hypothetical protein
MNITPLVLRFFEAHPRIAGALDRLDKVLGRPVAQAIEAASRRADMRLQIRACGGKTRWHEGERALRRRLDGLAEAGATCSICGEYDHCDAGLRS